MLVRLLLASSRGIGALVAARLYWGFIEAASNPTSAYIIESQRVVEFGSTVIFVVAAFAAGLAWRN